MGKSTISMAIFNSYVKLPEGMRLWFWGQEEGKDEEDEKKEDEEDREWLGGYRWIMMMTRWESMRIIQNSCRCNSLWFHNDNLRPHRQSDQLHIVA